jgi:hypothetical protein
MKTFVPVLLLVAALASAGTSGNFSETKTPMIPEDNVRSVSRI